MNIYYRKLVKKNWIQSSDFSHIEFRRSMESLSSSKPESRLTKKAIFCISTIQKSPLYLAAQLQLHHLSLSIGSNIWISTKRKPMLWLASFIRAMLPSSMLMNRIYHLLTISNLIASASLAANPPENSMTFWKSEIRKAASAAFFML